MDGTAAPGSTTQHAPSADAPSPVRVFLGDARLALIVLNQGRYYALNRVLGVSREQANLLTFVLALGSANAAHAMTRRVVRAPFPLSGADATIGAMVAREAVLGIAGPAARKVPLVGTLLTVAILGGVAVPGLRRSVHGIRAAELWVRRQRMSAYTAASRRRDAA